MDPRDIRTFAFDDIDNIFDNIPNPPPLPLDFIQEVQIEDFDLSNIDDFISVSQLPENLPIIHNIDLDIHLNGRQEGMY